MTMHVLLCLCRSVHSPSLQGGFIPPCLKMHIPSECKKCLPLAANINKVKVVSSLTTFRYSHVYELTNETNGYFSPFTIHGLWVIPCQINTKKSLPPPI